MEEHDLLEKITETMPESQNTTPLPTENVLNIKSCEATNDVHDESSHQESGDQNLPCTENTLTVQDSQANGVSVSYEYSKEEEKPQDDDLLNLNYAVSQEFKNQVIECIEAVQMSSTEDSNDAEYLEMQVESTENIITSETIEVQEVICENPSEEINTTISNVDCTEKTTVSVEANSSQQESEDHEMVDVEENSTSVEAEKANLTECTAMNEVVSQPPPITQTNEQHENTVDINEMISITKEEPIDKETNEETQEIADSDAKDKEDSFIFSVTDSSETELLSSNETLNSEDIGESENYNYEKGEEQAEPNNKYESLKQTSQTIKEQSCDDMDNIVIDDNPEENEEESELNVTDELEKMGCGPSENSPVSETEDSSKINESPPAAPEKQRNVIQDIFDDWQDEAMDEESPSISSKGPDSVELELKSLLQEDKTNEATVERSSIAEAPEKDVKVHSSPSVKGVVRSTSISVEHSPKKIITKPTASFVSEDPKNKSCAEIVATMKKDMQATLKTPGRLLKDKIDPKSELQSIKSAIKGRLMTSQLSSPVVNEVIKERLREKQKSLDPPAGVDVVFVKKLTQRLSHKLSAISPQSVPGLIPLSQSIETSQKNIEVESNTSQRGSNSDNKELLAILEGDVDPDWSNLKSPVMEEGKTEHSPSNKLDPTLEREIALKQLLELPGSSAKKKRKSAKSFTKAGDSQMDEEQVEATPVEKSKDITPVKNISKEEKKDSPVTPRREPQIEESRSGRKRKLTEKAREHEQSFTQKRQKKNLQIKKVLNENSTSGISSSTVIENDLPNDSLQSDKKETVANGTDSKKSANKQSALSTPNKDKSSPVVKPKQSVQKMEVSPIAKRKVTGKKMIQENNAKDKKPANAKAKILTKKVVKSVNKTTSATDKIKPKKKTINEIERLLQDEGVVNILYDVEQTDRTRRLVPITKSQTKVMDVEKAERELKQRKKLVRNAVLNLGTSNSSNVLSRSKRNSNNSAESPAEKKAPEQGKQKAVNSEVIFPTKIKNAADDSVIFRRHSTSSYSSAPGSPRIFLHDVIDNEFVEDILKKEETSVTKRGAKRKQMSNKEEQSIPVKKLRKSGSDDDVKIKSNDVPEEKTDGKKVSNKKTEVAAASPNYKKPSKVMTRSNFVGKMLTARKRGALKGPGKDTSTNNVSQNSKTHALSMVLAEAATALSSDNVSSGRPGSALGTRKNRGNINSKKPLDSKFDHLKIETQNLFSNKEVNVRRHGKLVQLILTPSSSSKLRNGISLQMMQEFREILSILKTDKDCHVVILTSTGTSFCEGIEIGTLLHTDKEERRKHAEDMANGVKEFIRSLATFNKPIVAGVQGAAMGLGVTMLPLFDLVIASDKATFSTPYGELGQIPEGASIISLSHTLGSAFANELLLGGRTMTASEALMAGLVTRVLLPDRFQVDLLPSLKSMSVHSIQSMEATKSLLRHNLRQQLDDVLESETKLLVEHWCSNECQESIRTYLDENVQ